VAWYRAARSSAPALYEYDCETSVLRKKGARRCWNATCMDRGQRDRQAAASFGSRDVGTSACTFARVPIRHRSKSVAARFSASIGNGLVVPPSLVNLAASVDPSVNGRTRAFEREPLNFLLLFFVYGLGVRHIDFRSRLFQPSAPVNALASRQGQSEVCVRRSPARDLLFRFVSVTAFCWVVVGPLVVSGGATDSTTVANESVANESVANESAANESAAHESAAHESVADEKRQPTATRWLGEEALQVRDWDSLIELVQEIAARPYRPEPKLPASLAELDYTRYQQIQFKHDASVWDSETNPFYLEFFHRGFVQRDRVDVYAIEPKANESGEVRRIDFDRSMFQYGGETGSLDFPSDIGFAGLRIAGRLEPGGDPREWLTFLGSSYYRACTGRTVYGTSARGLALDIAMNREEEFPDFRAFWVRKSSWQHPRLTVLAWMDSPSVVGAYRFEFDPGVAASHLQVRCRLFFRRSPGKLAIAPLTSMWMWGDGLEGPPKDDRPSVHDADGLLVLADGRQRWRPFSRIPYPSVSSIPTRRLHGFGLLQRNRRWGSYMDSNARYHQRPSVWVQPTGDWGRGRVELLELPAAHEGIDNIGAYFVPDREVSPSDVIQLSYQVTFFSDTRGAASLDSLATCRKMAVDRVGDEIHLTLDFHPPGMNRFLGAQRGWWAPMTRESAEWEARQTKSSYQSDRRSATTASSTESAGEAAVESLAVKESDDGDDQTVSVKPRVQTVRAELLGSTIESDNEGRFRVRLRLQATEATPFELQCELVDTDGRVVSETFQTLCPIDQPTFIYPAVYTRQE